MAKTITNTDLLLLLKGTYALVLEGKILYFIADSVDENEETFILQDSKTNELYKFSLINAEVDAKKLYAYLVDSPYMTPYTMVQEKRLQNTIYSDCGPDPVVPPAPEPPPVPPTPGPDPQPPVPVKKELVFFSCY